MMLYIFVFLFRVSFKRKRKRITVLKKNSLVIKALKKFSPTNKARFASCQAFHTELFPMQREVTAVNQKGTMLSEQCRPEDSDLITTQLEELNSRWDELCLHSAERQQTIEGALIHLGQFQLALEELLVWVKQTNATLDEQLARNVQGDVKFIEVEKAKHKVTFLLRGIYHGAISQSCILFYLLFNYSSVVMLIIITSIVRTNKFKRTFALS